MASRHRSFDVDAALYPFADRWLERDGVAMHFVDEGCGTPVLMLHGNPTWSFLYRDVIKALSDSCRCIAPDYPGFGFSDHPPGYGYTPQEHAQWIRALIERLQLRRYVLVVQDWGGPIGFANAVERPNEISGMVILNTWCWPPGAGMKLFSTLMGGRIGRYLQLERNYFARKLVPAGIARDERRTPAVRKAYIDPFPTRESRTGTWAFPHAIRSSAEWLHQIEVRLPQLRGKPTEMVWAMKDIAFGNEHFIRRWQDYLPGAAVDRVADAKHYIQEDAPDRVVSAVRRVLAKVEAE